MIARALLAGLLALASAQDFELPDERFDAEAAAKPARDYLARQDLAADNPRALANAMLAAAIALRPDMGEENLLSVLGAVAARFAVADDPEVARIGARAEIARASLLLRLSRHEEALGASEATLARFSAPGPLAAADVAQGAGFNRIEALLGLKRFAEAVVAANLMLAAPGVSDATQARATLLKALGLAGLKRYAEERELLSALIARLGGSGEASVQWRLAFAVYNLGVVEQALQRPDAALANFSKAIERYGKADRAEFGLVVFLAHRARVDLLAALQRNGPVDAARRAFFDYAVTLRLAKHRAAGAEALFEAAGALKGAAALALYEKVAAAFEADAPNFEIWLEASGRRAIALADRGQAEQATAALVAAVARADLNGRPGSPGVLQALRLQGEILRRLNLPGEADAAYADLLKRAGDNPAGVAQRAAVLEALTQRALYAPEAGDKPRAVALYGEIIRRFGGASDPDARYAVARALLNRGALLANLGREDECLADFTAVVSLFARDENPRMTENLAPARLNSAHLMLNRGRIAEARAGLQEFLRLYPRPSAYVSADQIESARRLLREAGRR